MSKGIKVLGDLTAMGAGYLSVNPHADVLTGAHNVLANVMPNAPTGDTAEILKMLVGLLIGVLSKFIYGYIDKKLKSKKEG